MATIKFSALVSEMRGKLNGSVASKNRGGNYLRNKVTPVNPKSTAQQIVRGFLSATSQRWGTLTEAQRQMWRDAAAANPYTDIYGDAKTLSGNAYFNKINGNRLKIGQTILDEPVAGALMPVITFASLTAIRHTVSGTNEVKLNVSLSGSGTGFLYYIKTTPQVKPGINFVENQYRVLLNPAAASGIIDITSDYVSVFGNLSVGQKIGFSISVIEIASGKESTAMSGLDLIDGQAD